MNHSFIKLKLLYIISLNKTYEITYVIKIYMAINDFK